MTSTKFEADYWRGGSLVAGIDEAGRGALAGPVVAAAVVFEPGRIPDGIEDSKVLSPDRRYELAVHIKESALSWRVAFIDHNRVDEVNILQATFDAMHAAINELDFNSSTPLHLLVDGNRFRQHKLPHTCIIDGDALCVSIAAASILAKTARDTWMIEHAHAQWPAYGFASHKGYATLQHRRVIAEIGPCSIHRKSFTVRL